MTQLAQLAAVRLRDPVHSNATQSSIVFKELEELRMPQNELQRSVPLAQAAPTTILLITLDHITDTIRWQLSTEKGIAE